MHLPGIAATALVSLLVVGAARAVPGTTDDAMLLALCPDGRTLRLTNTDTGESTGFACQGARTFLSPLAGVLADRIDPSATVPDPILSDGERIGEAQDAWSPLGLVCDLALGAALSFGSHGRRPPPRPPPGARRDPVDDGDHARPSASARP